MLLIMGLRNIILLQVSMYLENPGRLNSMGFPRITVK